MEVLTKVSKSHSSVNKSVCADDSFFFFNCEPIEECLTCRTYRKTVTVQ